MRNWNLVHKKEEKEKSRFLKRLTIKESFRIFMELYKISYTARNRHRSTTFNPEKINSLYKTHTAFKKIK